MKRLEHLAAQVARMTAQRLRSRVNDRERELLPDEIQRDIQRVVQQFIAERRLDSLTAEEARSLNRRAFELAQAELTLGEQSEEAAESDREKMAKDAARELQRRGVLACPRCHHASNDWAADLYGVSLVKFSPRRTRPGGYAPCLVMTCTHCGYMAFHNLVVLGIVPP